MVILIYTIIFFIGALIGSFASLAIYRIPLKEDIFIKHSYCPNCKEKLLFKDLIPIFSYIFLKGKCRHCGEKIRPRYFILEIVSGFLFVLFVLSFGLNLAHINILEMITIALISTFFVSLILIAGIDKENQKIESPIILFGITLSACYIIYMFFIKFSITYNLAIFSLALAFYVINIYIIKKERNKYLINLAILLLLSRIFMNSYIILFALILTMVTSLLHKVLAKTSIPIAFYYSIMIISTFIGVNFIV